MSVALHNSGILVFDGRKRRTLDTYKLHFIDNVNIIGFSEADVYTDESESDESSDNDADISDDLLTTDEMQLRTLTRKNTDFNSLNSNLLGVSNKACTWLDENDVSTERSALTGTHRKVTPLISISVFGDSSNSPSRLLANNENAIDTVTSQNAAPLTSGSNANVKINFVQPMKNGQIVDGSVRREICERRQLESHSSDVKITRLDGLLKRVSLTDSMSKDNKSSDYVANFHLGGHSNVESNNSILSNNSYSSNEYLSLPLFNSKVSHLHNHNDEKLDAKVFNNASISGTRMNESYINNVPSSINESIDKNSKAIMTSEISSRQPTFNALSNKQNSSQANSIADKGVSVYSPLSYRKGCKRPLNKTTTSLFSDSTLHESQSPDRETLNTGMNVSNSPSTVHRLSGIGILSGSGYSSALKRLITQDVVNQDFDDTSMNGSVGQTDSVDNFSCPKPSESQAEVSKVDELVKLSPSSIDLKSLELDRMVSQPKSEKIVQSDEKSMSEKAILQENAEDASSRLNRLVEGLGHSTPELQPVPVEQAVCDKSKKQQRELLLKKQRDELSMCKVQSSIQPPLSALQHVAADDTNSAATAPTNNVAPACDQSTNAELCEKSFDCSDNLAPDCEITMTSLKPRPSFGILGSEENSTPQRSRRVETVKDELKFGARMRHLRKMISRGVKDVRRKDVMSVLSPTGHQTNAGVSADRTGARAKSLPVLSTGAQKPSIVHSNERIGDGNVEIIVRSAEQRLQDEREKERKRQLLLSEGVRIYDAPGFSKSLQTRTTLSPNTDIPTHCEGKTRQPPLPPRRNAVNSDVVTNANSISTSCGSQSTGDNRLSVSDTCNRSTSHSHSGSGVSSTHSSSPAFDALTVLPATENVSPLASSQLSDSFRIVTSTNLDALHQLVRKLPSVLSPTSK